MIRPKLESMTASSSADVLIVTIGKRHPAPDNLPPADVELDLRRFLDDPAHRPQGDMLNMTGLQPEVRQIVFATPGARRLARNTARTVRDMAWVKPVVAQVACAGGKHRAAAMGEEIARRLRRRTWRFWRRPLRVEVRHLHVDLPRIVGADELAA